MHYKFNFSVAGIDLIRWKITDQDNNIAFDILIEILKYKDNLIDDFTLHFDYVNDCYKFYNLFTEDKVWYFDAKIWGLNYKIPIRNYNEITRHSEFFLFRADPKDLIENITNKDIIQIADFNDELWNKIQQSREKGNLIIFMGAGKIDSWVRNKLSQDNY